MCEFVDKDMFNFIGLFDFDVDLDGVYVWFDKDVFVFVVCNC